MTAHLASADGWGWWVVDDEGRAAVLDDDAEVETIAWVEVDEDVSGVFFGFTQRAEAEAFVARVNRGEIRCVTE